ncbi:MAG TPA: biosynthetic arginine decarboxylase [Oligoflexia bacterium]|nr:biosynthetic arginine decarboxylase [Oligoflexia bacterium]HMP48682.1 biosynthetic arginine decarboxylase [Oligoflexia bacterium]
MRAAISDKEKSESANIVPINSKLNSHLSNGSEISHWTIDQSRTLYNVENWGAGYFDINAGGNISVAPDGPDGPRIDLYKLVEAVKERDIELPVLFRFNGILRHRVKAIHQAFVNAIKEFDYSGKYRPTYPIKVNQMRQVVEVVRSASSDIPMGLEVGSKPELIAVLGMETDPESLLLCNGYKDENYIELALMSKKVGRRPIIIVEKLSEISLVLKVASRLNIEPEIGLRLKLAGKGAGRWERSGGDRAKFGLTIGEIVESIKILREANRLEALRLIHFHAGSQLTTISTLAASLKEATQVYVQLKKDCPNLTMLDVGGGLGVDYDGSKTNFSSSMNYTIDEYARDVVWVVSEICAAAKVPAPDIVTESGRATVAYHSLLVFDVLGIANTFARPCNPDEVIAMSKEPVVKNLASLLKEVTPKNCQESLHDAIDLRSETIQKFNLGLLSIEDRALAEQCYWAVLNSVCKHSSHLSYIPEDLERLPSMLTDTYFCNLSIFQSMPDSWAIQQIFPITPLNRLQEEPNVPVVLADITCDSDGSIDRFADLRDVKRYLPAHALRAGEPYYFVTFLVGAYQEILGDLHNLFGDTNAVHVELGLDGKPEFSNVVNGDTVEEVLKYVEFEKDELCSYWRSSLEQAVSRGSISASESGEMYRKYQRSFDSYTYLSQTPDNRF